MRVLFVLTAYLLTAACSSYETTLVGRDADGQMVTKTVAGVPIVVTVPQKIGFLATESIYDVSGKKVTEVSIDKTPIPLGESELVALDIKRPAYGTAKTTMKLDGQYPTELTTDVDDKTLDRVLQTFEKMIESKTQVKSMVGGDRTLISQKSYLLVYDPRTGRITRQGA